VYLIACGYLWFSLLNLNSDLEFTDLPSLRLSVVLQAYFSFHHLPAQENAEQNAQKVSGRNRSVAPQGWRLPRGQAPGAPWDPNQDSWQALAACSDLLGHHVSLAVRPGMEGSMAGQVRAVGSWRPTLMWHRWGRG